MLTSLVDAFSILVIFLIMNNATSQEAINADKMTLPKAEQSQVIQDGVVIKVNGNRYTVDSKEVSLRDLSQALKAAQGSVDAKKDGLIIVADKKLDYSDLSPVIAVGSQQGFSKFKFVVERKE
jgi:biopolymer transport protein ExbD